MSDRRPASRKSTEARRGRKAYVVLYEQSERRVVACELCGAAWRGYLAALLDVGTWEWRRGMEERMGKKQCRRGVSGRVEPVPLPRWWASLASAALLALLSLVPTGRWSEALRFAALGAGVLTLGALVDAALLRLCSAVKTRILRRRQTILPDRLLVDARSIAGGTRWTIIEHAGAIGRILGERGKGEVLLQMQPPHAPGLHIWEGAMVEERSRLDRYEWEGKGTWRRATPEEAQRFAAGLPVWEAGHE